LRNNEKNKDYKPDWTSWANVDRTKVQDQGLGSKKEVKPFDPVIVGPWMVGLICCLTLTQLLLNTYTNFLFSHLIIFFIVIFFIVIFFIVIFFIVIFFIVIFFIVIG